MRIISKFRDYYDGLSEHRGGDYKTKIWIREEKDVEVHERVLVELEERSKYMCVFDGKVRPHYLIIAGKVYPLLEDYGINTSFSQNKNGKPFMYTIETSKKTKQPFFRKHYRYREREEFFGEYPDMTSLCLELDSPVILVSPRNSFYRPDNSRPYRNITINPKLSDWDFQSIMGSPEIYQMIDTFVSNILVKDEMPISEMTNDEKIQSHGFDKVTSFRKGK